MKIFYLPKVTKFIESLEDELMDKILSLIEVLAERNGLLSNIDSKSLGKGLFELRLVGTISVRIFYCFHKNTLYLLHGIIKKTQKVPKREIDFAVKMKKVVEQL